jgi:hypothetical protein
VLVTADATVRKGGIVNSPQSSWLFSLQPCLDIHDFSMPENPISDAKSSCHKSDSNHISQTNSSLVLSVPLALLLQMSTIMWCLFKMTVPNIQLAQAMITRAQVVMAVFSQVFVCNYLSPDKSLASFCPFRVFMCTLDMRTCPCRGCQVNCIGIGINVF